MKRRKQTRGFTLIELITVIVLIGVMAGITAPLTVTLVDSFVYSVERKDLAAGAQAALTRMDREIRRLKNDTSVLTAGAGAYRFIDVDGRTLQFTLNGTNLERLNGAETDVLVSRVTSLSFIYYGVDGSGNLTAITTPTVSPNATDIKFIQITLGVTSGVNTINYMVLVRLSNVSQQSDVFN